MEEQHDQQDCPPPEELSAWYDAELQAPALEAHVASCAACQARVRAYRQIDEQLSGLLAADPNLRQRLKAGCLARLFAGGRLTFSPAWWRVAAACAAVALVSLVLFGRGLLPRDGAGDYGAHHLMAQFPADETRPAAPGPELANTATAPSPVTPPATEPPAPALPARFTNVKWVAAGVPPEEDDVVHRLPPAANADNDAVGDYVRHVWLVADARRPLRELRRMLPESSREIDRLIAENRRGYVVQLLLTDRDLQQLVDHFSGMKFTLLSPTAPQPANASPVRLSGKTVQYELVTIER